MLAVFRHLLNWSLLLRHALAVPCLIVGARQLLLIRDVKLLEYVERYGREQGVMRYFSLDRSRSVAEQLSAFYLRDPLATLLALFLGASLSWLIVTQRREQRITPLLALLAGWLSSRLGLYNSTLGHLATGRLHGLLDSLAVTPRLWLIGSFWTMAGLLLLLSTWPFRRLAQPASAA